MTEDADVAERPHADRVKIWPFVAVAGTATGLATALYYTADETSAASQPMLATLIAVALVAGWRVLEKPDADARGRRRTSPSSQDRLVTSWLGCFLALEAAFLLAGLAASLRNPQPAAADPSNVSITGTLAYVDGSGRHELAISGSGVAKPIARANKLQQEKKADKAVDGEQ